MSKLKVMLGVCVLMCGMVSTAIAAPTILRLGHGNPIDSHAHASALVLAEMVEKGTNGKYKIEIFPATSLGNERQMLEGAQIGSVDLVITSSAPLGNFLKDTLVLDIPYLFRDKQHAEDVLNGPIGQAILDKMPSIDLIGLAWGENGIRHLTNSKRPIKNAADLKGLKIRTQENPIHIKAFNMMGALATPLPFPEVFTALQQGVADGQENPLTPIASMKFDQVQPYLSLTGHVYSPGIIVLSPAVWNELTPEEQKVFLDGAKKAAAEMRKYNDEHEAAVVKTFKEKGIKVVEDFDKESCIKALAPLYEEMDKEFGEIVKKITEYGK